MQLRLAKKDELEKVMKIYKSVLGGQFCVWNDLYPSMEEVGRDFKTDGLYVFFDADNIIGVVSVLAQNEMDDHKCWKLKGTEISRVVIDKNYHGKGYAKIMVGKTIDILKEKGCKSIHLSVAQINIPAYKTYIKLGFEQIDDCDMYGGHYYLMEKIL